MVVLGGVVELLGALLFAAGLLTFVGAVLIAGAMIVAIITVHFKNGFWATGGGFEYNLILIAIVIGIALTGPGNYSFDALIF